MGQNGGVLRVPDQEVTIVLWHVVDISRAWVLGLSPEAVPKIHESLRMVIRETQLYVSTK